MRPTSLIATALAIGCASASAPGEGGEPKWRAIGDATVRLEYRDHDASASQALLEYARAGRARAAAFLGESFPEGFVLRVYPDRTSLTTYWRAAWSQPALQPECWMVASATRAMAVVLSPRTWAQSACGHDGSDATQVRRMIEHEIVHVLHGQLNPLPEINAVGAVKWLNEGLAYYAAGQLDDAGRSQVRALVAGGYAPSSLGSILAGQGGYPAAASVVAYIDAAFGRDALKRLLRATSTADVLTMLGTTEPALLEAWRASQR